MMGLTNVSHQIQDLLKGNNESIIVQIKYVLSKLSFYIKTK